jgi:hypothetical protein
MIIINNKDNGSLLYSTLLYDHYDHYIRGRKAGQRERERKESKGRNKNIIWMASDRSMMGQSICWGVGRREGGRDMAERGVISGSGE